LFRLATNEKDATYEWYKDRIEERVPGTCLWFLEHEDYQKWLKQKYGPLLVTADPGCGKSVLAKYLIDEGLPRSETICYFFFKDQDQNTVRQALCAVLHQLFSHKPSLIKYAINQFSKDGHGLANSTESLWKVLESATSDPEAGSITIVFDALDECAEHEFPNLLRNMNTQLTGTQHIQLKYVLTCRPYEQIMSRFRGLFTAFPNIHIPGEENSEIISQEVNCVITHRVNRLSEKHQLTDNIKSHLEERLRSTSNRTYLWVHLVFNYLESTGFKQTQTGIDMSVSKLPKSINEAYEQILNRSAEHSMVRKALCVILAYKQPITISEMNIAMSIDFTLRNIHDLDIEDDKSFISRLRSWCGLFISIHHGKLYFLHQTAREFLLKDSALISQSPSMLRWQNSITTHETHTVLTEICLLYLELFSSKFEGLKSADDHEHHLTDKDEFLTYSAWYWMDHFRKACIEDNAAILSLALKVYDSESMNHKIWRKVYGSDDIFQPDQTELHIASLLGHTASVKFLINNDKGIGKRNKDKKTPLHYASSRGCCPILELLLNNGADIEAKDINEQTPLSCAAQGENIEVVEMLLNRGADIEAKDETGCTPLSLANQWGTIEIIKLLLNKGADIETKANTGRTPLFWAVIYKAVEVPELLLNRGADIEAKDNEGRTPLSWAARYEGFEVLKLLISWSADIEARDNEGRTPLSWAAAEGTVKGIVNGTELLLSRGADIEARDNEGRTPLSWAAAKGTVNRTKLLLDSGADIEARDNEGRTPLSWATLDGSVEVTELLLNRGADIDAEDHEGRTPLYWASDKCVRTTVSLLLKKGARIDTRYWDSATMLEVAKSTWIEEVIDLLSTRRPIVIL
jgi:ankyrin repeat protein